MIEIVDDQSITLMIAQGLIRFPKQRLDETSRT